MIFIIYTSHLSDYSRFIAKMTGRKNGPDVFVLNFSFVVILRLYVTAFRVLSLAPNAFFVPPDSTQLL